MSLTTPKGPKGLFPDQTFMPEDVVPEALIHRLTTPTVAIEGDEPSVRVPYITDEPDASFTNEDTVIPESDIGFSEVLIKTRKLAILHRSSREAVTYPNAAAGIATAMGGAIIGAANEALLHNAANPTGLLNTTGIHDAGTMGAGDLDVLSDAITAVEAMGGTADAIVMDPLSWGQLRKLKTSTGSAQLLLGNPADQTDRRLFGVEVIVSANMPQGSALVIDSKNVLSSSGPITITQSGDFYFDRDAIAYRVTWRFGWTVVHPERLAKVAITLPSKG